MSNKIVIGIDPDVDKCGVGMRSRDGMTLISLELWNVFTLISRLQRTHDVIPIEVVIERYDGKNRSWHGGGKGSAFDVGRNAEIANQIVKYCEAHKIKYRTIQPKGYSKINAADFKRLTGYEGQTNKDTRVGGLIAYNAYLGTI